MVCYIVKPRDCINLFAQEIEKSIALWDTVLIVPACTLLRKPGCRWIHYNQQIQVDRRMYLKSERLLFFISLVIIKISVVHGIGLIKLFFRLYTVFNIWMTRRHFEFRTTLMKENTCFIRKITFQLNIEIFSCFNFNINTYVNIGT